MHAPTVRLSGTPSFVSAADRSHHQTNRGADIVRKNAQSLFRRVGDAAMVLMDAEGADIVVEKFDGKTQMDVRSAVKQLIPRIDIVSEPRTTMSFGGGEGI